MLLKYGPKDALSTLSYQWMTWQDTAVFLAFHEQGIACIGFSKTFDESVLHSFQEQFPNTQFIPAQKPASEIHQMNFYLAGTPFQRKVWEALFQTTPGKTETYTSLAQQCHLPRAVRAVASAVAQNPLAYVIPCHRVLRLDGHLGGFRWAPEMKIHLLNFEQDVQNDNKASTQADAAKLFLRSLC